MLQSWRDVSSEALLLQSLLGDASSERLSFFPERAWAQGSLLVGKPVPGAMTEVGRRNYLLIIFEVEVGRRN